VPEDRLESAQPFKNLTFRRRAARWAFVNVLPDGRCGRKAVLMSVSPSPFLTLIAWALNLANTFHPSHQFIARKFGSKQGLASGVSYPGPPSTELIEDTLERPCLSKMRANRSTSGYASAGNCLRTRCGCRRLPQAR
jgi:hypothetical protein